ncbi:MAG: NahK/ErcS family hybrid sensor histidine kinase/response regulator, partial [Pseudomonadota bacterium]
STHNADLAKARWLFPAYLVAINIFVVPIAIAGLLQFGGSAEPDMFVLALPMSAGAQWVTLLVFIGGLSAATAMVIVATVALSIMIGNELVMPLWLRQRPRAALSVGADGGERGGDGGDMGVVLLAVRRGAILAILLLAYLYYRAIAQAESLSQIGLLSFAAIAQLAPAFFIGLFWRRATRHGAIAGMVCGTVVWAYTLLIPTLADAGLIGSALVANGAFGMAALQPQSLFGLGLDPLSHGVLLSLLANVGALVGFSLLRGSEPIDRMQAGLFMPQERTEVDGNMRHLHSDVAHSDLEETVARFLGTERTRRAFADHHRKRADHGEAEAGVRADIGDLRFAEHLLTSAIGTASARIVLSLLLRRDNMSGDTALKLLDDASNAIQQNRDLLQTALDQVSQGIAVFNRDLQLICWNRQFRQLLALPPHLGIVGVSIDEILSHSATRGDFGPGPSGDLVRARINQLLAEGEPFVEPLQTEDRTLEIRSNAMPDGGIVVTYADVTERVKAQEALARANALLERRVDERTEALVQVNEELSSAKAAADQANASKTRFLAAAGHDVMQPLNAARLYVSSLIDNPRDEKRRDTTLKNLDSSLEAVEDILGELLDISKLDSGAMAPTRAVFDLGELLESLRADFQETARQKAIDLRIIPTRLNVLSDRRMMRRILQNLISNGIKYTKSGSVLVGARRIGRTVRIEVHDTGTGIPPNKQASIFREFSRLDQHREEPGLGLGLSIVERMCAVLEHPIQMSSTPGRGSTFSVELPRAMPKTITADVSRPAPTLQTSDLTGCTILCVDNEISILDGMEALLTGWGCTVVTAVDRLQAARAAKAASQPIDLILADYHLDNGTGLDAILHLRWKLATPIPAILITADRTIAIREEAEEKGIPILHKPVKPAALRALMRQQLTMREAAE